ncbi:flavodoxin domain-containing protein [Saccharomonospora azurea]|uniref:Flavodoxin n=1 Tax=Saccharomonospora azurea NA-128 TaxID=882081 RepID=H8G682_9PSEU|nr:flavodoxin domain-containing protein [Saccharomonospora azurea]EHY87242.1 flavodoxin [Saccharomonospora azurea NA-128]
MNVSGKVLVAYATAAGSTEGVASFVADRLRRRGGRVDVIPVDDVPSVEPYDTVVLGSAVHNRAFLPQATTFAHEHRNTLRTKSVWLFSVGIGPSLRGPLGRKLGRVVPKHIAAIRDGVEARDYHAFAGVVPREGSPLMARVLLRLFGGRYGDLRDWDAIESWAGRIPVHQDVAEM